jgi:branched-chain amino acid transport system substrate-binding protein
MKNWIIGIIVLILVIVGVVSMRGNKETGPIKIGVITPLTGDAAVYGEAFSNIYKLAVKEINDAGGVNGRMLELVIEDGKCTGPGGANAAQKLVNIDKVQVILGGMCSSETLSALPIAESAKVALISSASSNPDLTGKSKFFARNWPSDSFQGKVLADVAYNNKKLKNVYILAEQTDYTQGIKKVFEKVFTEYGGTITSESFASSNTDLKSLVTKAKSSNAEGLVVLVQTGATGQKIFKSIRDLNWKTNLFLSDTVTGDSTTMTEYKDVLEGSVTALLGTPNNEIFNNLLVSYKNTYGEDVPYQNYAPLQRDVVFMITDAIKAVGYNGEKIADWFHNNVKDWQGAAGLVTIGPDGDPLVGHRAEIVKNGKTEVYNP